MSEINVLTPEIALNTLNDIVRDYGHDHVYVKPENAIQCQYVEHDTPGCIMAHLFTRLGIPLEKLSVYEGYPATDIAKELFISVPRESLTLISMAQMHQDNKISWGRSVALAWLETYCPGGLLFGSRVGGI